MRGLGTENPDAQGPLDPLKHQIDIADLQVTRDLFAFDRLVLLVSVSSQLLKLG